MLAYITTSFRTLSHTFIRREVAALRARGHEVALFGIREEDPEALPEAERKAFACEATVYPLRLPALVGAHLSFLFRHPLRYLSTFLRALFNEEKQPKQHLKLCYHFLVSAPLARTMERRGVSHLHAHFLNVPATIALFVSRLSGIPYSITVHSAGTAGLERMIGLKWKFAAARFLLPISHYNIEVFGDRYGCRERMHVVRCGIDPDDFPPLREWLDRSSGRPLAEAAESKDPMRLLAIGRFVEKKGFTHLLAAMSQFSAEEAQLTLIGDGPDRAALEAQAQTAGIGDRVHFAGSQSQAAIRTALAAAEIVVVPSVTAKSGEKEGIPVVLMEAMAMGVPVISTRHSGIPELVVDGHTGLLVEEADVPALVDALRRLHQDADLQARLREGAFAHLAAEFLVDQAAAKIATLVAAKETGRNGR